MRIGFGSTDWNRDFNFYTYCDVPLGETDPKLTHFSVQKDIDRGIIDVVREFRAVNPDLQILASVWGVPAWMTSNKQIMHGLFNSEFAEVYADYLVKSVQAYAALGIPIQYLTIQNEPATGGDRATPAAMWTWEQERDVLLAVGKRFADNRIGTKLWLMDHNFDMAQSFAKPLLDDPRVKRITQMVAFHDYRGRPEEMALLGRQHPDVPAVLSERGEDGMTLIRRGKMTAFDAENRSLRRRHGTGHEVLASELRLMTQTACDALAVEGHSHATPHQLSGQGVDFPTEQPGPGEKYWPRRHRK